MTPYPEWFDILSGAYLGLSFACAAFVLIDEFRRPQKMMIMNVVWPLTALYGGPLAVWGYLQSGLKMTRQHIEQMQEEIQGELHAEQRSGAIALQAGNAKHNEAPSAEQIAVGVSHCGAGCTLGDLAAEWWVFLTALHFAGGDFTTRILLDFLLAWSFGVVFQYFTIAPMRGLYLGKGIIQAIRVDTLSIVAFQIGMSAWMALVYFAIFPGPHLAPNDAVFWFMMQMAMMVGFFASYPVNRFLLRRGWKEKMPQSRQDMKRTMRAQRLPSRLASRSGASHKVSP